MLLSRSHFSEFLLGFLWLAFHVFLLSGLGCSIELFQILIFRAFWAASMIDILHSLMAFFLKRNPHFLRHSRMFGRIIHVLMPIQLRIPSRYALYLKMDEVIAKGIAVVVRELAHLGQIYLVVVFETVENVLEILRVAWYVKCYGYHCDQMMDLGLLELSAHLAVGRLRAMFLICD